MKCRQISGHVLLTKLKVVMLKNVQGRVMFECLMDLQLESHEIQNLERIYLMLK